MTPLAARVREALRLAPASFREAFELFEVVETEAVATASVGGRATPVVRVNPRFVAGSCPTPETLAMLLMHEALHVVLGHTARAGRTTLLDNVVCDAVINAILSRMRPGPEWTELFARSYSEADPVACFLRPAPGFAPPAAAPLPAALAGKPRSRAASLYRSLYGRSGVPEADLRAHLAGKVPPGLLVLGGHGERGAEDGDSEKVQGGSEREDDAPARRIAREALERFAEEAGRTAPGLLPGAGRALLGTTVNVERTRRRALAGLIRRIAGRGPSPDGTSSRRDTGDLEVLTVLPAPDRRSVLFRAAGTTPLLFRSVTPEPRRRRAGERVHLYLDVSGSVAPFLGALYAAVRGVRELIAPRIHLFSTALRDVTPEELSRGVCFTTGGTSLAPVVRHLRENAVRRAVIVTDGAVGRLGAAERDVLGRTELGLALTGDAARRGELARLARHVVVLDAATEGRRVGRMMSESGEIAHTSSRRSAWPSRTARTSGGSSTSTTSFVPGRR